MLTAGKRLCFRLFPNRNRTFIYVDPHVVKKAFTSRNDEADWSMPQHS